MTPKTIPSLVSLALLALAPACATRTAQTRATPITAVTMPATDFHAFAPSPPMGWNSWDCFGTTVTEKQTQEQTDFMAEKLKAHGWEYIVVDIQWYEASAKGHDYKPGAKLAMDAFSRLVPAVEKFPSAAAGQGFKPLADYVHAKGLKFGIHMMRGISRQAVQQNTPIKGSPFRAADIADTTSTCTWNPDMYGVDMSKPGAQAYYDSLIAMVADWGVDFIKVDDLSRPYHQPEVEAIRKAIDKTGRPIVFSTSPGETPLSAGASVNQNANLWRISDDFWDAWPQLLAQFKRLHDWTPHRLPGAYPDADMLPLGLIKFGKPTGFTREEQFTLMTLWSIARSPLIHGGDLTRTDDFTLSLLTNDEVLAVNQHSAHNRQLFRTPEGLVAWVADVPGSTDKYLALFNTGEVVQGSPTLFESPLIDRHTPGQGVAIDVDIAGLDTLHLVADEADGDIFGDHIVWSEPRLIGPAGELKLTELGWTSATTGWRKVAVGLGAAGQPLRLAGKPVPYGIGAHARSDVTFALPPGYTRFQAFAALDDVAVGHNRGATVRFRVFSSLAPTFVRVPLAELGVSGEARVRDLWTHADLAPIRGELSAEVPPHGARLFRVGLAR